MITASLAGNQLGKLEYVSADRIKDLVSLLAGKHEILARLAGVTDGNNLVSEQSADVLNLLAARCV